MFHTNLFFRNSIYFATFYISVIEIAISAPTAGITSILLEMELINKNVLEPIISVLNFTHIFFVISVIYLWVGYALTILKRRNTTSTNINFLRVLLILFPLPSAWLYFVFTYNKPFDVRNLKRQYLFKDKVLEILNLGKL